MIPGAHFQHGPDADEQQRLQSPDEDNEAIREETWVPVLPLGGKLPALQKHIFWFLYEQKMSIIFESSQC